MGIDPAKNVAEEAQRILLTMHKNIIILHDVHELKMVLLPEGEK